MTENRAENGRKRATAALRGIGWLDISAGQSCILVDDLHPCSPSSEAPAELGDSCELALVHLCGNGEEVYQRYPQCGVFLERR